MPGAAPRPSARDLARMKRDRVSRERNSSLRSWRSSITMPKRSSMRDRQLDEVEGVEPERAVDALGQRGLERHLGGAARIEAQPLDDDRLQLVQDFLLRHRHDLRFTPRCRARAISPGSSGAAPCSPRQRPDSSTEPPVARRSPVAQIRRAGSTANGSPEPPAAPRGLAAPAPAGGLERQRAPGPARARGTPRPRPAAPGRTGGGARRGPRTPRRSRPRAPARGRRRRRPASRAACVRSPGASRAARR